MRQTPTPAERKLWLDYLCNLPFRVRRQCPLNHFIVDFYCHKYKLVIELDGERHFGEEAQAYDAERTEILEGLGLHVIRFTNREVMHNFEGVCERLEQVFAEREGLR